MNVTAPWGTKWLRRHFYNFATILISYKSKPFYSDIQVSKTKVSDPFGTGQRYYALKQSQSVAVCCATLTYLFMICITRRFVLARVHAHRVRPLLACADSPESLLLTTMIGDITYQQQTTTSNAFLLVYKDTIMTESTELQVNQSYSSEKYCAVFWASLIYAILYINC